jgi:hypothetical protein
VLAGWRGSRSGSTARRGAARGGQRKRRGGGRKDRATRGIGSGWCRAAGAREAAGGGGHVRAEEHRRSGARGRRWRTRLQKVESLGTLV